MITKSIEKYIVLKKYTLWKSNICGDNKIKRQNKNLNLIKTN